MTVTEINFLDLLKVGSVQFRIPRWQRRFSWGSNEITRLIEDLLAVARSGKHHYGGSLITFEEPKRPEELTLRTFFQVVDGQQRLTTISIILACIAEKLGPGGQIGSWSPELIRSQFLECHGGVTENYRKLRLQNGDEEVYRQGLEGSDITGNSAIAKAWRIIRKLVHRKSTEHLIAGLGLFQIISIKLKEGDNPQQIFQTLNATGKPLAESEKVKNWLLMGLPEKEQEKLHDTYWLKIVKHLGAEDSINPIDDFLRDMLRWRLGRSHAKKRTYEVLTQWMHTKRALELYDYDKDRTSIGWDLSRLSELYGIITGTSEAYPHEGVERELRHLRAMGVHTHRPLTLRLLNDVNLGAPGATDEKLAIAIGAIGTWITRMWISDLPMAGMNSAMAAMAWASGPQGDDDFAEYWIGQIQSHRKYKISVPDDDVICSAIRIRGAFSGGLSKRSFAILCALMEAEQPGTSPHRDDLSIVHVMPRELTPEWKTSLGASAEIIHEKYRHTLANLTLSDFGNDASIKGAPFWEKKEKFLNSAVGMNRRIGKEPVWDKESIENRAKDLCLRVLDRWPWVSGSEKDPRWRINGGAWQVEPSASQMLLNVAAELLSINPFNAQRLSGKKISSCIHRAGTVKTAMIMKAIPGHPQYVIHPYASRDDIVKRCKVWGKRCGESIEAR